VTGLQGTTPFWGFFPVFTRGTSLKIHINYSTYSALKRYRRPSSSALTPEDLLYSLRMSLSASWDPLRASSPKLWSYSGLNPLNYALGDAKGPDALWSRHFMRWSARGFQALSPNSKQWSTPLHAECHWFCRHFSLILRRVQPRKETQVKKSSILSSYVV
jgi:hypothetical protein